MNRCLLLLVFSLPLCGQVSSKGIHPQVKKIIDAVSEERIAKILRKLESFGSRNTNYDLDSPDRGNVAARTWISKEFQSYSPKLQVHFDTHRISKQGRIVKDLDLVNVVAVLPGTTQKEHEILISGHYDSLQIVRKQNVPAGQDAVDWVASAEQAHAPGVSDDASGVALVMELARIMSAYEWPKTLVFVAFAGEEQGLFGSRAYAKDAHEARRKLAGIFNNDIIGNDLSGDGRRITDLVNVYSGDPMDSSSRALARYVREVAERYDPAMKANPVFRGDRFSRGGDHTPFHDLGYPAIRFTTPVENYANQHSATDTFENASPSYTARVTRVNGAAVASLALAPAAPEVMRTNASGVVTGPNLTRGKGYDAAMKWVPASDPDEIAGYSIAVRSTTAPFWEREVYVGKVTEYLMPGLSIDDIVLGVRAIGKNGVESPISAYTLVQRNFNSPAPSN
ncbi:M20/M25/M40 family metallo-hydrolase [Bryobacter aggregatus]|uniref:M20/M25/M40 family metallo-hydrolase n=1 Tax=Bryobacter aggregatus TaxID=360054 RepID=UPI000691C8AE|nr:M20/M25/M40 family metallo-hydrolase [Bryobacter aggregatus]